jgi:hypothetical protein
MRNLVATTVERRAAKRVNLNLRSRIRYHGLQHAEIVIRNLSFTGFNGDSDLPLKRGDIISVNLPNIGLVRATVKWSKDGKLAGAFHRPVDVRDCFRGLGFRKARSESQSAGDAARRRIGSHDGSTSIPNVSDSKGPIESAANVDSSDSPVRFLTVNELLRRA